MRPADAVAVERRLERVDTEACAGLVADIWAARGFDVDREGDAVVARRGGDPLVIHPMPGSRLAAPRWPDRPVDVVVAPRGGRVARAVAARHDARLVDASDLLELLRYAVSPAAASAICERHLGAAPTALRPPLRDRILDGAGGESIAAAALALALVVVAVGTTFVAAPVDLSGDASDPEAAVASPDPAPDREVLPTTTSEPRNLTEVAPGLSTRGIENLSALRDAHGRELRNESYVLRLRVYQPYGGATNKTPLLVKTNIAVESDRYWSRTVMLVGSERTLVKEVYYDGRGWYSRQMDLLPADRLVVSEPFSSLPRELPRSVVETHLDTSETTVTENVRGRGHHRIIGHGPPPGFATAHEVRRYTVVAFVSDRGIVDRGRVEYTIETDEGRYDGLFRWNYDRIGETTVDTPAWYRNRYTLRNGTDRTTPHNGTDRTTPHNGTDE